MTDTKTVSEKSAKQVSVVWGGEYKFRAKIYLGSDQIGFLCGTGNPGNDGSYHEWYPYIGRMDGRSAPIFASASGDLEYLVLRILVWWLYREHKISISEIQESDLGTEIMAAPVSSANSAPKTGNGKNGAPKPIGA